MSERSLEMVKIKWHGTQFIKLHAFNAAGTARGSHPVLQVGKLSKEIIKREKRE